MALLYNMLGGYVVNVAILFFANRLGGHTKDGKGNRVTRWIGSLFNEDSIGL